MKKRSLMGWILLLCWSALAVSLAETKQTEGFADFLKGQLPDGNAEIVSVSEHESMGAAILRTDKGCTLMLFERRGGQWCVSLENDRAVSEASAVRLESEDRLVLIDPVKRDAECPEEFVFDREDEWILTDICRYEGGYDDWGTEKEMEISLQEGMICPILRLRDPKGKLLLERWEFMLPDVLTWEERLLSRFNGYMPVLNGEGYPRDEATGRFSREIFARLFALLAPEEMTFSDGLFVENGLVFLAEKEDGSRVLLCCGVDDERWVFAESSPLPAGTTILSDALSDPIRLGGTSIRVSVMRCGDGSWCIGSVNGSERYRIGNCMLEDEAGHRMIGSSPWRELTGIDWTLIPESPEQAKRRVSFDGWATPNNPDPAERLLLREKPQKGSRALGRYCNGTPIRVLERGETWSRVRVGQKTGYMMSRYLAFGTNMERVGTALVAARAAKPAVSIRWEDREKSELLTEEETAQLLVIGAADDREILVWHPQKDAYGRIQKRELSN